MKQSYCSPWHHEGTATLFFATLKTSHLEAPFCATKVCEGLWAILIAFFVTFCTWAWWTHWQPTGYFLETTIKRWCISSLPCIWKNNQTVGCDKANGISIEGGSVSDIAVRFLTIYVLMSLFSLVVNPKTRVTLKGRPNQLFQKFQKVKVLILASPYAPIVRDVDRVYLAFCHRTILFLLFQ